MKIKKTFKFTQISVFCYGMLAFIQNEYNPFEWSQDSRIILIIWIFIFFTIVEFIDNFREEE